MSLDQTLGAAPDPMYDPQSIVAGLVGQQEPDLVQNGAVDPQAVLNRLIRKQLAKQPQPQQQGAADFASFGKTKDELGPNAAPDGQTPDFASFGQAANEPNPAFTGGGKGTAESPYTGEVPAQEAPQGPVTGALEAGAAAPVSMGGGALKTLARGLAPLENVSPETGAIQSQEALDAQQSAPKPPAEASPIYQAGEAAQQFAKENIGPSEATQKAHPIATMVGGGIGGVIPGLALGALNPALGIAGTAALFGASSAEDTYEAAKKHGADDETAANAAMLSGTVNAALGALPIASVLKPIKDILPKALVPQFSGLAMNILAQAAKSGITFATVGEAQEFLGQQIAKMYDPKAGYSFDTERLIADFMAGAALGALHAGFAGRGQPAETGAQPAQPGENRQNPPNSGALPPPGEAGAGAETGAGPQPQPGTGGAGAQQETAGAQQTGAGEQQEAPESPQPFESKLNPKTRTKLEDSALYYMRQDAAQVFAENPRMHNWSEAQREQWLRDVVRSWSDDDLKDYVNTKFGFGSKRADDEEIIKRYGVPPDEAAAMSPEEKAATAEEAVRNGVHAGEAPPAQGTADNPVDLKTGEDVAAAAAMASQEHSHAQGEAGNFQRGHATWDPAGDGSGLNLSIEVPAGGVRKGTVKETGQTWETTHPHAYGEILGVPNAADGMRPDVIVGPHPDAPNAYVIDEKDKRTGKYKQSKALIGFLSPGEARQSYLGISSKVPEQIAAIEAFPSAEFPKLVREGLLSGPVAGKGNKADIYKETPGAEPGQSAEPAAPAPADHRAIEDALRAVGVDPKHIRPVDLARAAEIHAQEGYSPEDAFQLAVARAAVEDGLLTPEQVSQNYGPEIASLLHAGQPSERGVRAAPSGAAAGGSAAAGANERIPGGGANGAQGRGGEAGENAPPAQSAQSEKPAGSGGARAGGEAAAAGHPAHGRPAAQQRPAGGERNAERERGPAGGEAADQRQAPAAAGAPLIGDRVESLPEHKVTAADGTSVKVVPVVLDAAKLITSSDAGYDKDIQPRQRERAASQAQIREIATRLDPERLGYSAEADRGAPIVGPDRMVESGNGRVQAIRAVYAHNPKNAAKYRSWLKEQGVDTSKYKDPILVRQRVTDLDQERRKAFAVASNQAATLAMSAPERALADAGEITPHMLDLLTGGDLDSLENRKFVRAFVGALPATERGALSTPEGGLSAEGLTRVRNAILAKAYGDPDIVSRITESTDDDVKSISNALVASAPLWAKLRNDIDEGHVPGEFDLTKDLMEAVKRTADMRGKGQKLEEYLAQQDAFDHIEPNVDGFIRTFYDPNTKRAKSGQRIADFLRFYATEAAKVSSEAGLDLGLSKVTPHEIQTAAAEKTEAPGGGGVRAGGAAERNEKQRPGAGKSSRLAAAKKFGRSKFRGHKLGEPDDLFGAEPGADNKPQLVIPGAEQRSSAELAKRRATEPLKPRVAQKPLEEGLFGEGHKQTELFEPAKPAKNITENIPEPASEPTWETMPREADLQAADSDETVHVKLTDNGPWDFNDTWPMPDLKTLQALEREGRSAFGEAGPPTVEQVVSTLDESMNEVMSHLATAHGAAERIADIESGKTKLRPNQDRAKIIAGLRKERAEALQDAEGMRDAVAEVFGDTAADALEKEAHARLGVERASNVIAETPADQRERLAREEKVNNAAPSLTEAAAVPTSQEGAPHEPAAPATDLFGGALQPAASRVSAKQPRAPRPGAARASGPDELPLFARQGSGGVTHDAHDAEAAQPAVSKPPIPGEGEGPGSVPASGGRKRAPSAGVRPASPAASRGLKEARAKIAERSRLNYRITDEDQIGEGGAKTKARANIEAIRTLKAIEDEAREATPEEKAKLVKYTGWGALAQQLFDTTKSREEWQKERDELRALLEDSEYEAARKSTLNAHYTSPDVIRGMWAALDHLGFDGGLALEPSLGVGHFIGLIPDKVAPKTAWTATELDPITGRIAKLLYAGADVGVRGYEELKRPSNYYDLAVSNVPFGDYNVTEKPYGSYPIHDFFFVKSLDKVRPGGVVAFITSRYTMDRKDPATRRLLARTADLVGAIRLPGGKKGAFASNAGTEVTTDIIFLRKKIPGEPSFVDKSGKEPNWLNLKTIQTPDGPVEINEYFADRPHMMLGEMRLAGTQYRKGEPALIGDPENIDRKISTAAQQQMAPAFTPRGAAPPPKLETLDAYDIEGPVKDGAFFVKGEKVFQRRAGQGFEQSFSADDADRVKRLAGIRDVVNDLLAAQINPERQKNQPNILRAKLRGAYDAFVKKYGPINKEVRTVTERLNKQGDPIVITRYPNFAKFKADPDAWKVAAIEHYDPESGKGRPADIQEKDVIEPPRERTINSPADALAASLDDTGGVDLNHIAESLGLDGDEAAAHAMGDLIYLDPDGRKWKTSDEYLSGDVVKKLEDARATAAQDTTYQRNVAALERVQPEPLTRHDITAQFGAPWVPEDVYAKFMEEEFGASNPSVERVPISGQYKISFGAMSRDARSKYGTDRVDAGKLLAAALNNTTITVYDRDANDKPVVNQAATEEARIKAGLISEAFSGDPENGVDGWAFKDEDRAQRLEAIYNRTFNNVIPRKFDGSHLTLPGLNPDFATRQHRKDAVWRMIQRGNTLLAHVVGSGKTATMIAGGMEMRRLGLINKPAYVIPNHMLEQFSREFIQAYPNAKILVAQKEEMTPDNRKAFLAKVSANDWDGVIITHDAFGRINISTELRKQFVKDQLYELERVIRQESTVEGKKSPTVKMLEKMKERLEDKLGKLMNEERKDVGTSFEETGIDHLFVDEAHLFKNLAFITRMSRVKGLAQGDSQRAEDLFLKIHYLEQKRPGRSAVFATGTPVSNTMAELWTMMRYLELDELKKRGLDNFDAWAQTFGRVVTNMELSADGRTFQQVSSFSKFVNVPELISLYSEIADTKTADMLNLPRPEVKTRSGNPGIEIVEAEPSPQEEQYIQSLVKMAEEMKGKRPKKGEPNMLSVVTLGRKVATDGRLIGEHFDFNPEGKVAKLVNNIHDIWAKGQEPGKAQMVFLDLGVPNGKGAAKPKINMKPKTGEDLVDTLNQIAALPDIEEAIAQAPSRMNLYQDIKERLVAKGIPPKQIAFIHDASDDAKKGKLFSQVRAGEVRVLIGSTGKMGVGTNAQTRLIAMHHADAPWKPAEVEQRDGRIVRQGNLNPNVHVLRYVTRRSFDAFMWQKLDTKSKFIAQVLSGARGARTAEDIDSPLPEAAEMKAAASGDPRILEHAELDRAVRQLQAQRRAYESTQASAQNQLRAAKSNLTHYEASLPAAKDDAANVKDLSGDNFKADIGGLTITERKAAGEAIIARVLAQDPHSLYRRNVMNVGKMSGFDMNLDILGRYVDQRMIPYANASLKGNAGYGSTSDVVISKETDPVGLMRRFERVLAGIKENPDRIERLLASERANVDRLQKTLNEKWPKEGELERARAKLKALTDALRATDQAKSAEGMPSLEASSGETGGASNTSASEAPPETQPSPGFQVSTAPAPLGSSTTRETPPSIFPADRILRFSGVIGDIDPASKKYILQGSNDIKALRGAAEENKPEIERRLNEIAAAVPGTRLLGARVKDLEGLIDKVEAKGRAPNTISDYLGARVVADTPAAMEDFARRLHETGGVIEAENFLGTGKDGYRAYHLQVGLGDGTSAEIQLVPKPIADVMDEAHEVRQPVKRILDQSYASPEDLARAKAVMAQSNAIFDRAWDRAPEWQRHQFGEPERHFAERAGGLEPGLQRGASGAPSDSGAIEALYRGAGLGGKAQDYVLARGRETGDEHLIALDQKGGIVGRVRGEPTGVSVEGALAARLSDPANSIVVHHNHPKASTLSNTDITMLGAPGLHAIWAHGHNGTVSRAGLTDFGRSLMTRDPERNVNSLAETTRVITFDHFFDVLKEAADRGLIDRRRANDLLAHLANETLRRLGIIDYQTNDRFEGEIASLDLEQLIDATTRDLAGSIRNGNRAIQAPGDDGRTGRVYRHPGDMGTSFGGGEKAPGRNNEQASVDRQRRGRDRGEEAEGRQLRLLEGEPRFELREPTNRFQDRTQTQAGGAGAGAPPPPTGHTTAATPQPPGNPWRAITTRIADALGGEAGKKAIEGFSDYSHRMRLLQNDVEALHHQWISEDGRLPDEQQFYTLKRLFPGKRAARVDEFNKEHFEPLAKFLRDNRISEKQAGDYLYAKHAAERNRVKGALYAQTQLGNPREHDFSRARRDPNVVGASGMSLNQANGIIRQYENGPKAQAFAELLRRVDGIRRFTQAEMLRGGLESAGTIAEWNRAYEHYVPLQEWDDPADAPDNVTRSTGRGRGDIRGAESRPAFGRRSKADNPLAHLISQAYRTIDRAERDRVYNSMANALAALKRAGVPIEKLLGIYLNKGRPQKQIDPNTGLVRTVDSMMDRFGDNAVQFKRGGEPRYFVFDDRATADAVRRWSPAALPGPLHALLWLMNKMKSLWTHYSPNFLVRHNARYYVESVLNAMELKESGPHSVATHARQAFPIVGEATRAIFAVERGLSPADAPSPDMADLMRSYQLMKQHGGVMAMRTMRDIDQIKEDIRVHLNDLKRGTANVIRQWHNAVEWMNHVSSVWDNAQRLATMHSALKQGKSPQEAALLARDATIDYQYRGLWSNIMGLWEPFFNTALRTGFRLGGAMSRSKIMRGVFFGTLAMGLAASAWNYFVGGKDKDGIPFFDKIPSWERSKAFIILAPWIPDEKGRPSAVKFPFPYNWGGALSMGYGLGNFLWGSEPIKEVLKEAFLKPFVSMFSEIGEEGIGVRSIVPELIRPEYDIATNRDWAGRPIHMEETFQKGPNAYSGKKDYGGRVRTGEGWKDIAEILNDYSGGARNRSGLFDFYPEDVREVLNPFIGTQIGFGNEVGQTAKSIAQGQWPDPTKVPIGRVFFGQDYDAADRFRQFERSQKAKHPWMRIDEPRVERNH